MFSRHCSSQRSGLVFFGLAIALGSLGCDSTELDPFQNDGRYYSVYGFLKDGDASHAIRVIPVRRQPERITTQHDPRVQIDAFVTTTDTTTGEVVNWTHVLTRLEDGSYGHIYHASFNVKANHTYRLEILRNDGITTRAETTVPLLTHTRVQSSQLIFDADSSMYQDMFLPNINSPWSIEVVYHFAFSTPTRIAYDRDGESVEGEGWKFRIDYARDIGLIAEQRGIPVEAVEWAAMGVKALVQDRKWDPPQDIFDPEILAQPGALSNVENGYGFFGSVAIFQDSWPNSDELNAALGF